MKFLSRFSAIKYIFFSLVLVFFISSCARRTALEISGSEDGLINLADSVYWAETDAASDVYIARKLNYQKLDTHSPYNLDKVCGKSGKYVWLKMEFKVPNCLKYRSLGLVITYLHFSDKVWLNDMFIGSYGKFPPNEKSSLFLSHCYYFPENVIKNEEINTILIKVWVQGRGSISDEIFVSDYESALAESNYVTFWNSRMYLIFEGAMFCAFILYFMMYIWRRKDKSQLAFACLNFSTILFLTPFFATELPWYNSDVMSFLLFIKISLCLSFYLLITFASYFIIKYLNVKISKKSKVIMYLILFGTSLITILAPTYNFLMKLFLPCFSLMLVQISFGVREVIKALFNKDKRKNSLSLLLGFTPVLLSMLIDVILRVFLKDTTNPYISMFGWQLTIIVFIVLLTIRYNKVYAKNEYLNEKLEIEVQEQTKSLSEAKEKLEREKWVNDIDLEMASIVQQKFFPFPSIAFKGWDIAICYKPVAKVSGDLYDYYHTDSRLDGFSLFDVSGHGIAASLITMLSKNIVYRAFRECFEKNKSISAALYSVNNQIIEAKGDIENYLTGILLRFSNFDEDDTCFVDMANAGHPHPILYSAKQNESFEITHAEDQFQYGAIGIGDIEVSFPAIKFKMERDDIFICFTDGLTESMNSNREQFGKERVKSIIKNCAAMDAQSILEELIDSLMLFSEGVPRDDDLTIIILKRRNSTDFIEEYLEEL